MEKRDLTKEEISYINHNGKCPFCKQGQFLNGPCGGSAQNVRCNHCGQEFWFAWGTQDMPLWMANTLDRDMPNAYGGVIDFPVITVPRRIEHALRWPIHRFGNLWFWFAVLSAMAAATISVWQGKFRPDLFGEFLCGVAVIYIVTLLFSLIKKNV